MIHLSHHIQRFYLFKSDRETTENDPRTGRTLSAFNEEDVDTVQGLTSQDARYTVEEVAMLLGINSSTVLYKTCIKATTKTPQGLHQMGILLTNW